MWCAKRFGKYYVYVVLRLGPNEQVFQHWELPIHGHQELRQYRNRQLKADVAYAITFLECKHYSLFVFHGNIATFVKVVDNERKRRRMC